MSTVMRILLNGEGALEGVNPDKIIHVREPITITALHSGMVGGGPSIGFLIPLPDGGTVFAETSMRLFHVAAKAFASVYGWQDDGVKWETNR